MKILKKYYYTAVFAVITAVFIALASAATNVSPYAETLPTVKAQPVTSAGTSYIYFEEIRDISYADGKLLIASSDGDAVTVSDKGEILQNLHFGTGAEKIVRHGDLTVTLESGKLKCFYAGLPTLETTETYKDFVICPSEQNYILYALSNQKIVGYPLQNNSLDAGLKREYPLTVNPKRITASAGRVFITASSDINIRLDDLHLFNPEDGSLSLVYEQCRSITELDSAADGSALYALTNNELLRLGYEGGVLKKTAALTLNNAAGIAAAPDKIYISTQENGVDAVDVNLSNSRTLFASATAAEGYFNSPSYAYTKKNRIFVADTLNDRIGILTNGQYSSMNFIFNRPTGVAADNVGNVYVSHNGDTLEKFDYALKHVQTFSTSGILPVKIHSDNKGTIYMLTADGKLYSVRPGSAPELIKEDVTAFNLIPGGNMPYIVSSAGVYALSAGIALKLFDINCNPVDFCLDIEKNVFILDNSGNVYAYYAAQNYAEDLSPTPYEAGFNISAHAKSIQISTVQNNDISYGDLIVADKGRHSVKKLDGGYFKVKVIDENFTPPTEDGAPNPVTDYKIIRTALIDTEVYLKPMDAAPCYIVARGRKVIVPQYDISESEAYSYVLIDDIANSRLVAGYVFKDTLSEPLPYAPPKTDSGKTYNELTPIYKWPSRNAEVVDGYNRVPKGTAFTMLEFVENYTDDYADGAIKWYRLKLGDLNIEGYIPATSFSLLNFTPDALRPQYNAEVVAYHGSLGALTYTLEKGEYLINENITLATGTKLEVVGAFNPNDEFTKVLYFDEELGSLECYVKTAFIRYNRVNVMQIVAVIIIALTLIIGIVIVLRVIMTKRKI